MNNFVSVKNFKHLYQLLNQYSNKKYNKELNFKKYKNLIGNTINEISLKFKKKINTKEKNIMTIIIIKNIIDKKNLNDEKEKNFFESDFDKSNDLKIENKNHQLNNFQYINIENQKKNIYNKIINNNYENIKVVEKNEDLFRKNLDMKNKKILKQLELKKNNIKNINEKIIIDPKNYIKTLEKHKTFKDFLIDSRDRNDIYDINSYFYDFPDTINNIYQIDLLYAIIPNTDYIINNSNNILHYKEENTEYSITVPIGNYNLDELTNVMENLLNANNGSLYTVSNENINMRINNLEVNGENISSSEGDAFHIFDKNLNTHWIDESLNDTYFIYDFQRSVIINKYYILCSNHIYGKPKSFNISVSFDKINWNLIDSQVGISIGYNRYKEFLLLDNYRSARYLKIEFNDSSNDQDIAITQMDFQSIEQNRINISSDMTFGTFSLLFENKENSIREIIGFKNKDYHLYGHYTSDNEIILEKDQNIYLSLSMINNVNITNDLLNDDIFLKLTLNTEKNKHSYINKQLKCSYISDKLLSYDKILIQFKKYNNNLYDFHGINHSMLLRIHYFDNYYNY